MATTLPQTSHEHHARLTPHVDALLKAAESVRDASAEELRVELDDAYGFLTGLLMPHMEAAERTLYPELERLLENGRAMAAMTREHVEIRRLVAELGSMRVQLRGRAPSLGQAIVLRRILYRLFAILKVHLEEEEMYLPVLEHNLAPERRRELAAGLTHAAKEGL